MKNKINLEVPELITILTLSIGLWYFMYEKILKISAEDQYSDVILSLAFSHFLIFINICFALILLYNKTITRINSRMFVLSKFAIKYLTNLWLPITTFCFINYFIFRVNLNVEFKYLLLVNSSISIIITTIIFAVLYQISLSNILKKNSKDLLFWLFLIIISYTIYIPFMSVISSDIDVKFDKDVYKNENVNFRIVKNGYIFLPHIKQIRVGGKTNLELQKNNLELKKEFIQYDNEYMEIFYEPQVINIWSRKVVYIPYINN